MRDHDKDEEEDKKKKIINLKSTTQEEEEDEELSNSKINDTVLFTKRYKKYLRFRKGNNLKKYSNQERRKEKMILHALIAKGQNI